MRKRGILLAVVMLSCLAGCLRPVRDLDAKYASDPTVKKYGVRYFDEGAIVVYTTDEALIQPGEGYEDFRY